MESLQQLATRAHSGISFSPERRGQQHADSVRRHLEETRAWLEREIPAEHVEEALAEYRAAYEGAYRAWLGALSRCVSPMIAGPSNFPTRRMEKRNATERRRLQELVATPEKLRRRILRRYQAKVDPRERADAELEKLEKQLELSKAINKIVKGRRKLTDEEKVAALLELGLSEAAARKVMEPVYGEAGIPGYQLTSLNGKIKRRRAQLASLHAAETAEEVTIGEATIEEDPTTDRLRIRFPDKPSETLRTELKRNGFRWSRANGAWQRQLTNDARRAARRILEAA